MHLPRTAPRLLRRSRTLVAAAAAAALVTIGLASPASAGTPAASTAANTTAASASTTAAATPKVSKKNGVKPLCTQPKKGAAQCFALKRTDVTAHKGIQPSATVSGYGPADLSSAYALPANGGAGQTVAIVDAFDDPNAESDLATYRTQFGLPACTTANGCFRKVDQRGGTNYPTAGRGLGRRDLTRRRHGLGRRAAGAHPARRGRRQQQRQPGRGGRRGRRTRREVRLQQLRQRLRLRARQRRRPVRGHRRRPALQPPRRRGRREHRRHDFGVSYPAASQYVTSVGGTTLVADLQRARLVGIGVEQLLRRPRQRLLNLRGEAVLADRHRLRQRGPRPTSRRSPTR